MNRREWTQLHASQAARFEKAARVNRYLADRLGEPLLRSAADVLDAKAQQVRAMSESRNA